MIGDRNQNIVLFGAGSCGRYALKYLRSKGIEPVAFADSDPDKWDTVVDGVKVNGYGLVYQRFPDAVWVATAISRPAATEIRAEIKSLGVETSPLWECLDVKHGIPSRMVQEELLNMVADQRSEGLLLDQLKFRRFPEYEAQMDPDQASEIYFPDFIKHLDDEYFVDCGAADGDTVAEFRKRWSNYAQIRAFEPDRKNYRKLSASCLDDERNHTVNAAISGHFGQVGFTETGDYSAHLGSDSVNSVVVNGYALDDVLFNPTYIKMDIEGAELEALWGARRILKEHKPVLAICAYHTSDHLWEIPLLIHAIQPDYKLFLRRYAEGAWELVWYAVPAERLK